MNDYSNLEARLNAYGRFETTEYRLYCSALKTLRAIDPSWSAEQYSIGTGHLGRFERFRRGVHRQLKFNNPRAQMLLNALAAKRVKARLK